MIYVDNNATTALAPEVLEAMMPYLTTRYGNAASVHAFGSRLMDERDRASAQVSCLLGAGPKDEITFTSGGTESNNAIIRSVARRFPERRHVVTSTVEHSSVGSVLLDLELGGYEITRVPVDRTGSLDLEALRRAIRSDTALVTLMWANNETGVLFPLAEISRITRERGVLFHCDAVQAVGKIPLDLRDTPVDFLSVSAHKLHGPKGVGVLFARRGVPFDPFIRGGAQQNGRRAGTEDMAGMVGLGEACAEAERILQDGVTEIRIRGFRDRLEEEILSRIADVEVAGRDAPRLNNTAFLVFDGLEGEALLQMLSDDEIYASGGSACTAGTSEPSHVLMAMGYSERQASAALRFSLSRFTTEEEIDLMLDTLPKRVEKLRALCRAE